MEVQKNVRRCESVSPVRTIIYIKADRNIEVTKPDVILGDAFQVECSNPIVLAKIKTMKLFRFDSIDKKLSRTVISVLKVIELIHKEFPESDVQNLGESDVIITLAAQKSESKMVRLIKAAGVVFLTFAGAAFSIMAFNNDVDTTKLFQQIYTLLTGKVSDGFTVLEFTYCIGLVIGILVFFNHFGKKRFTADPTPIEVEMRTYENEIQTTLIETYSRKEKEIDVGATDHAADYSGTHRT